MLITANVGTIFEESILLDLWFQQLKSYLIKVKPQLVAIHCQEVGGKNFGSSMKNVSNFTDRILGDQSIIEDYSRVRIFLDENYENLEKFTALGSLYLVHDSVENVKLYNFKTAQYQFIAGRDVQAAGSNEPKGEQQEQSLANETISSKNKIAEHVEKVKFPQELFPECRWSRKGFMRTRWLFNDCQPLDLVNIHLFHDASNIVAMKQTPSPYAQNRQKALEFALKKIADPLERRAMRSKKQVDGEDDEDDEEVPLFIFGDFNFRLDTSKVIQRITDGVSPLIKKSPDGNEVVEFIYHRKDSNISQNQLATQNIGGNNRLKVADSNFDTKTTMTSVSKQQDDDGNFNHIEGGGVVMTVGKKLFDCENLDETFRATKNCEWLQELDYELDSFKSRLYEFKISFSPSYPFKEDTSGGYSYMKTRCPAWCDRILFNAAGDKMIYSKSLEGQNEDDVTTNKLTSEKKIGLLQKQGNVIYRLMGNSVPMGDHKPVLLYCQLNVSPRRAKSRNEYNLSTSNITATNTNSEEPSQLVESTAM